jgi:hypothetical protein
MGATSPSLLLVAGLGAAAVGWLLLSTLYQEMPPLPWTPTIVVAALAVAEGVLAQNTRARILRKPGHPRVNPLAVARYAVLAKASSLTGAIYAGFSAGLLSGLLIKSTVAAQDDLPAAIAGVAASAALIGAALWLERACRVPETPDDEKRPGQSQRP